MIKIQSPHRKILGVAMVGLLASLFFPPAVVFPADPVYDCAAKENRDEPTTVEFVLSKKWKGQAEQIKRELMAGKSDVKVRVKFYPIGDPPANIGVGKCVTAQDGRLAIQQAVKYYGKLDRLIRQDILPHHWIKLGSTDTAELAWVPIGPDDLGRLTDPALSTGQFQDLYRHLAMPKERKRPFGMGSEKIEESP
jgi:hypothetical protein